MSLPSYLAQIKSSGIYRFVWDKSEASAVDAEILRLVVGYSEVGPFNTPVYIKTTAEFKQVFGDISKKLEKRGIYFHRLALQALSAGPILALNLKKFASEEVKCCTFDATAAIPEETASYELPTIPVESVYDTTRFWKLNPEGLPAIVSTTGTKVFDKYIALTSSDSDKTSCSVIIRGCHPSGYDVTIKEWYTLLNEELPEYLTDFQNKLVSDFFAEVYVFKGKFDSQIVTAEPLSKYFEVDGTRVQLKEYIENAFGEKTDTLEALASEEGSNFINSYQGILLPQFKNLQGSYISLDLVFNAGNSYHKMLMNFDADLVFDEPTNVANLVTTGWETGLSASAGIFGISQMKKTKITGNWSNHAWTYSEVEGTKPTAFAADFKEYKAVTSVPSSCYMITIANTDEGTLHYDSSSTTAHFALYSSSGTAITFTGTDDVVYKPAFGTQFESVSCNVSSGEQAKKPVPMLGKKVDSSTSTTTYYAIDFSLGSGTQNDPYIVYDIISTVTIAAATTADLAYESRVAIGLTSSDRLLVTVTPAGGTAYNDLARYTSIVDSGSSKGVINIVTETGLETTIAITDDVIVCNHSCSESCYKLAPVYLKGYTFASAAPEGSGMYAKLQWQKNILKTLTDYTGIRLALTNRTDIDYRYIVDTFEAFVDSEVHKELSLIAKEKDNALALLNFPSASTFKSCPYTSFTDANNNFKVKYIKEGGNRQKPASVLFSLCDETNGASFASYNTPLTFTDGTVKTYVPAAAMVSNNFMQKYLSRQPYYIVAGPTYGRMVAAGMVGPDFNYSRADLDILEPMGVNVMVYVPRLGTYINSNQTAKQTPVTALSKINVRELVIYLQDEIEKLLQNYQWEFNTQELRDTVKAKADTICERVKNNGGIYEYLNVCDETNNTDDVINNEMFVLSTSIEPGMGCGKMVQELTIYKKGGMASIIK